MAKAYQAPIDFPDFNSFFDEDGKFDYEKMRKAENEYVQTLAAEAKQNGDSELLGEVVRWQRGDGYAMYMVWETKPLTLIHLDMGDGWTVEEPLMRGLRVSDVKEMVAQDRKMAEIFSESRKESRKES